MFDKINTVIQFHFFPRFKIAGSIFSPITVETRCCFFSFSSSFYPILVQTPFRQERRKKVSTRRKNREGSREILAVEIYTFDACYFTFHSRKLNETEVALHTRGPTTYTLPPPRWYPRVDTRPPQNLRSCFENRGGLIISDGRGSRGGFKNRNSGLLSRGIYKNGKVSRLELGWRMLRGGG